MSVPHPSGDPNANIYAQLKRDVLDRVPQITAVEYVPDDIEVWRVDSRLVESDGTPAAISNVGWSWSWKWRCGSEEFPE